MHHLKGFTIITINFISKLKMVCGRDIVIEHYGELRKSKRNSYCLKGMSLHSTGAGAIYAVFIGGHMKSLTSELL